MTCLWNVSLVVVLFFAIGCSDNRKAPAKFDLAPVKAETFPDTIPLTCTVTSRQGYSSREAAMKNLHAALPSSKFLACKDGDESKGVELTTTFKEVVTLQSTIKETDYHQYFGKPEKSIQLGSGVHLHLMVWIDSAGATKTEKAWAKSRISTEIFRKDERGKFQVVTSSVGDSVDRVLGKAEKLSLQLIGTELRTALYNIKDSKRIMDFKYLVAEQLATDGFLISSSVVCER